MRVGSFIDKEGTVEDVRKEMLVERKDNWQKCLYKVPLVKLN